MAENKDNILSMLCHLLAIFFGWLPTLIIWLVKRNDDDGVDENGKNVLNLLISVFVVSTVLFILFATLGTPVPVLGTIFFLLWLAVVIASKVLLIIGTIKTSQEGVYEYPFWSHYPLIK